MPIRAFTLLILSLASLPSQAEARFVQTPYENQNVLFDFYFDDPQKIGSALYWVRSFMNPLMDSPYDMAPEFMNIIVLIHGTEIVTLAKHNYKKYRDVVERMRYYEALGVKFKVCGLAAADYDYQAKDFYDFVELTPSAITELSHWQQQGYSIISPTVMEKKFAIEDIR